jgi:Trk K+ transport system NAD-binding subunit
MLSIGYGVFFLSSEVAHYTEHHWPFKLLIEPLLAAMIGSFLITNYSTHRAEFAEILERIGPVIYVLFFTFTGVSLRLDILGQILHFALAISLIRVVGIMIGTFLGGTFAREPLSRNRIFWMCFVTQAGVALGLAREVADEFPLFGEEFATLIISVVVFNELIGPPFFKNAIKRAGEANIPEHIVPDRQRDVVIFGVGRNALALARQLKAHDWSVIVADLKHEDTEPQVFTAQDTDIRYLDALDEDNLRQLITVHTDAAVAMMQTDDDNLKVCQRIAGMLEGIRLSVRLNDPANMKPFLEMGATVVNPTDAIIALLDQAVRAPQSAALFMHRDPDHEIVQVTIIDPDFDNLPLQKLRLPPDVLILNITRDGQSIVPHGYTKLRLNDEVTLLGDVQQLRDTTLRLGY